MKQEGARVITRPDVLSMRYEGYFALLLNSSQPRSPVYDVAIDSAQDGYATNGANLWRFNTIKPGPTESNYIQITTQKPGPVNLLLTSHKIFIAQGWCWGCTAAKIVVVSRLTFSKVQEIPVGSGGFRDAFYDEQGGFAYFLDNDSVWKIDVNSNKVVGQIQWETTDAPPYMNMQRQGDNIYVVAHNNSVVVISLSAWEIVEVTAPLFQDGLVGDAFLVVGRYGYIAGHSLADLKGQVRKYDSSSNYKLVGNLSTPGDFAVESLWADPRGVSAYMLLFGNLVRVSLQTFTIVESLSFDDRTFQSSGSIDFVNAVGFFGGIGSTFSMVVSMVSL